MFSTSTFAHRIERLWRQRGLSARSPPLEHLYQIKLFYYT